MSEDRASFERLVREIEPDLHASALRLCGNRADARDLVQDTLERAFQRIDRLSAGSNVRGWLGTILHNRFIDILRMRQREPVEPLEEADEVASKDPGDALWQQTTPEELHRAMDRLDADLREVCWLHGILRRSYKEISRQLGIPEGTVGTRLLRARLKLRAMLTGEEGQQ